MKRVAVILSGCGHLDGSEIREAVLTLLELDKHNANVTCFAPNIDQHHVINHITGDATSETRNVLVESARIARGAIEDIATLDATAFDALILPGGYGAAKNLSTLAFEGPNCTLLPELQRVILAFIQNKKPIGAICIAPAVLVAALRDTASVTVTIGDDSDHLISALGGHHQNTPTTEIAIDDTRSIVSCSAYMREDRLAHVAQGIEKLVAHIMAS